MTGFGKSGRLVTLSVTHSRLNPKYLAISKVFTNVGVIMLTLNIVVFVNKGRFVSASDCTNKATPKCFIHFVVV